MYIYIDIYEYIYMIIYICNNIFFWFSLRVEYLVMIYKIVEIVYDF